MDTRIFTEEEFSNFIFKSEEQAVPVVINKEVKNYINISCIKFDGYINRYNPLHWAACNGHLEMVKYLVDKGANITTGDNYAVRWAAENGHLETVKYLLSTYIYSEEYIHDLTTKYYNICNKSEIKELMLYYRQFPRTKACK